MDDDLVWRQINNDQDTLRAIRDAIGDPDGEMTQDELAAYIKGLVEDNRRLSQKTRRLAKYICKGLEDEEQ